VRQSNAEGAVEDWNITREYPVGNWPSQAERRILRRGLRSPSEGASMRALGWVGILLVVAGVVGVASGGIPYTKSKTQMEVGPLKVEAKEKGFIPPIAAVALIVVGGALVAYDLSTKKKA